MSPIDDSLTLFSAILIFISTRLIRRRFQYRFSTRVILTFRFGKRGFSSFIDMYNDFHRKQHEPVHERELERHFGRNESGFHESIECRVHFDHSTVFEPGTARRNVFRMKHIHVSMIDGNCCFKLFLRTVSLPYIQPLGRI